jgi:hypothetical protein
MQYGRELDPTTHKIVIAGIDEHKPNFTRTGEKRRSAAEFEKIGSYRNTNDRSGKVSTVTVDQKLPAAIAYVVDKCARHDACNACFHSSTEENLGAAAQ